MNATFKSILLLTLACVFSTSDAWARGGRMGGGGGRMGGGGGARSMGRVGGGGSYPSMSRAVSRPSRPAPRPSVSRPQNISPNISRPNVSRPNVTRPATRPNPTRPNIQRPAAGGRPNVGGARPGTTRPNVGSNRPGSSGRPSANDLNNFLGMHGGNRPTTLPGNVNRPGNRLPGNGTRPGINNRPNFDRPNISNRPNIGNRPNVGNRVNVGNNVNINRQNNVRSIRNHWAGSTRRPFNRNWWARHPTTLPGWRWHRPWNRYPGSWYWRHAAWPVFGTWFAWSWSQPVVYDYGSSVVYRDNYVYVNDQQVATTQEYYQQADTIATNIPEDLEPEEVEWMPLGVFAIAEEGGVDSGMLIQLAVSKEGIIAGTFYNDLTDDGRPLEGSVDRESQRAAWRFADGKNKDLVMETPIYNLTQDESTALVHFGAEKTQTWLMVRLDEEGSEQQNSTGN